MYIDIAISIWFCSIRFDSIRFRHWLYLTISFCLAHVSHRRWIIPSNMDVELMLPRSIWVYKRTGLKTRNANQWISNAQTKTTLIYRYSMRQIVLFDLTKKIHARLCIKSAESCSIVQHGFSSKQTFFITVLCSAKRIEWSTLVIIICTYMWESHGGSVGVHFVVRIALSVWWNGFAHSNG